MELKFDQTAVNCYDEVFSQTLRKEETQDSVVPDTMPDIGAIVCCTGSILIRGKDVSDGRVRLEANVPARVVYTPEEGGGTYCLDLNLPLYASLEDPCITENSVCVVELYLAALEARTLNPRKISVRAEAVIRVCCYAPSGITFSGAPEEETEGVNLLEKTTFITPAWTVTEKTFVLSDDFSVPSALPPAAEILGRNTLLEVEEIKSVGTRLVVKGCAKSALMYVSGDGESGSVRFETGFSQVVEAGELPEEIFVAPRLLSSGEYYDIGADGRTGTMELHLVIQVVVYGKTEARSVVDAYSSRYPMAAERETDELDCIRAEQTLRETLRETLPRGAIRFCGGVSAIPGLPQADGGTVTLPLTVQLLGHGPDGMLCASKRTFSLRFSQTLDAGQSLEVAGVTVQEPMAAPAAGGAEIRVPVELQVFLREQETVERMTEIQLDETGLLDLSNRPSLVILRASDQDDLWALAKENCSTVRAITEANGIGELAPGWEKLILIPKIV